jgi:transposase-like protein
MRRYSKEFKEQGVRKMMPPNAQSVAQVDRDTGGSESTLYTRGIDTERRVVWRRQIRRIPKVGVVKTNWPW